MSTDGDNWFWILKVMTKNGLPNDLMVTDF
jgi:hypothetical protein